MRSYQDSSLSQRNTNVTVNAPLLGMPGAFVNYNLSYVVQGKSTLSGTSFARPMAFPSDRELPPLAQPASSSVVLRRAALALVPPVSRGRTHAGYCWGRP